MTTTAEQRAAWAKAALRAKPLDRALVRHRDVLALLSDMEELSQFADYLQRRVSLTAEEVAKLGG